MNKLNEHELQSIFENFSECPVVIRAVEEMLSLREQLAELKALPASGYLWLKNGVAINCLLREPSMSNPYWEDRGFSYKPLFTAAKPAEIPRHIYSMLVNELRDVPAIGCKRELIIGVLNRHGVTAEPVQFDPPATE
ncbi:TPA: polyphosphate kinase [Yersinia enterocolitica]